MICWLCEFKAHRSQRNDRSDSLKWEIESRSLAAGHRALTPADLWCHSGRMTASGPDGMWLPRRCLNLFPSINCAHRYSCFARSIILRCQPHSDFFWGSWIVTGLHESKQFWKVHFLLNLQAQTILYPITVTGWQTLNFSFVNRMEV